MVFIVGVRFKSVGKVYYFDPGEWELPLGAKVIVETSRGIECGEVALEPQEVEEEGIVHPLKRIIRIATEEDLRTVEENREKQERAFAIGQEKIRKHGLDMTLIDVEYTFDGNKILFYFTAEGRIDFRELVKDLASVFRTRIELRQIGVRDEAKMLGGLGVCGRPFCCATFLDEFQPVSIKMAKEQGLSLNPTKISGTCGRLMCCLKYEQEAYEDLLRTTPKAGSLVETPEGRGIVTDVNLLTGKLSVRLDQYPDAAPKPFSKGEVTLVRRQGKEERRETPSEKPEDREPSAPLPLPTGDEGRAGEKEGESPKGREAHRGNRPPRSGGKSRRGPRGKGNPKGGQKPQKEAGEENDGRKQPADGAPEMESE